MKSVKINLFLCSGMLLFILVTGCTNKEKNKTVNGLVAICDSLFSMNSDIRKYNFGMAREEFDLGDDSTILENEKDLIVESIFIKSKDSTYAECSYHFENNMFQSIEINIFSKSDSLNLIALDSLKKRMKLKFGHANDSRGFATWNTRSKKGYRVEIFLGDISYDLESPAVQIQIHADLVERPMMASFKKCKYKLKFF